LGTSTAGLAGAKVRLGEFVTGREQVEDNLPLLEQMLSDHQQADSNYQTTNYWVEKNARLVEYLRSNGLENFRQPTTDVSDPRRVFTSFGATDDAAQLPPADMMKLVQRHSGGSPARDIRFMPASKVGRPFGFDFRGRFYTTSWLNYYLRYVYVARFINLSQKIIIEIGPGSGKQAHLLKLAHPDCTIVVFDIPPQSYVANQYLSAVLGDDCIGYDKTREFRSSADFTAGKVHVLCNWQIEIIREFSFDLLWNAASFQEMEPDIVRHYLKACSGASNVYLMEAMTGQTVAPNAGEHGVLKATTMETYRSALKKYELRDLFAAPLATPIHPINYQYVDSFWSRRRTKS
jgi:putative sugar O-methyltransferase